MMMGGSMLGYWTLLLMKVGSLQLRHEDDEGMGQWTSLTSQIINECRT
jgi:hypothetical protein